MLGTLDLKSAYYQIPLCKEGRPFTAAFEADGKLYQYTRLHFGVTNGVSYFQHIVDNLIEKHNLREICAYLDNVTVFEVYQKDHDENLKRLVSAAKCENVSFYETKCSFSRTEIDLLGYRVSHHKIQPDPERLRPLFGLPLPTCKSELQRAIGMFAYYAKWIPNFSTEVRPVIQSNLTSSFPLTSEAAKAFETLRNELSSSVLTCVKEGVPFVVECCCILNKESQFFTAVYFLTLRLEKETTRGIAKPHTKSDYYVTMRSNIKQDE